MRKIDVKGDTPIERAAWLAGFVAGLNHATHVCRTLALECSTGAEQQISAYRTAEDRLLKAIAAAGDVKVVYLIEVEE